MTPPDDFATHELFPGSLMKRWTVIHKGRREHYAIPRILNRLGLLDRMLTDVWWPPALQSGIPFARTLGSRWHRDLESVHVLSLNRTWLARKVRDRIQKRVGWKMLEAEDEFFQNLAATRLRDHFNTGPQGVCFAYSYTALKPFRAAKVSGWKTVLGQIDLGEREWDHVDQVSSGYRAWEPRGARPSRRYWQQWKEETELADVIIANSDWSAESLIRQGVPAEKLRVVSLLYEPYVRQAGPKIYPLAFSEERPLRVLFLGSICQRKGVAPLLSAMRSLGDKHVHLQLMGPCTLTFPLWVNELIVNGKVSIKPPAKEDALNAAYNWADVFILPTFSDGFAITQLEAQARKLPVIASSHCGRVVAENVNGRVLPEVSSEAIAQCLREILADPAALKSWSEASDVPQDCRMVRLVDSYLGIARELE